MGCFRKFLVPCLAVVFLFVISFCEAKDFVVGGSKSSWRVPSSPDEYNKWAERKRFHIGDSIVFRYDGKIDSVLRVTEENYKSCNLSNPIQSYDDGHTRITLDKSGPFYFISGAHGHCGKDQKVEIRVISAKHGPSPAPSPSDDHHAPAPAPKKSGGDGLRAVFVVGLAAAAVGVLAVV
ncbi:early nodulin-like protein [Striga asiatica]|uniref:Early nodulin-like protein n=1 Tax=Striga asiatica TaxID=4170 RepID=A0A5A7QPK1_STRAF|nr:early nodulin-like protein [Striga asiatica]